MRLNGRRKPDMGRLTTPTLSDEGDVNKKDVSDGTVTLKKSVCTGHFRYPAIMSAKTP